MDFKSIGKRLKMYREMQELNQAQFAEKVNLSNDYISKIECGKRLPTLLTFVSILNALNASADVILFDVLDKGHKSLISGFTERIGKLSKDDQKRLFAILEAYLGEK